MSPIANPLGDDKAGPIYDALPDRSFIRVIRLLPGVGRSTISISLQVFSISSLPRFEALSYVWGDSHRHNAIVCDTSQMMVTTNVYNALLQLRSAENTRLLWVDAISINQDGLEERAYQVTLMKSIYRSASRIIIWLGMNGPLTESARDTMLEIEKIEKELLEKEGQEKDLEYDDFAALPRADSLGHEVSFLSKVLPSQNKTSWTNIKGLHDKDVCAEMKRLLSHPWFRRSWCVQEAAYASIITLLCGNIRFSWDTLRMTCFFLREQRGPPRLNHAWQNANGMVLLQDSLRFDIDGRGYSGQQLEYLLPATRHLGATDPRDKIYAFLGLSEDENWRLDDAKTNDTDTKEIYEHQSHQWSDDIIAGMCRNQGAIIPDYTVAIEDLYSIVTKRLMHGSRSLTMLSHSAQSPSVDGLPSWVPDWRKKIEFIVLGRIAPNFNPFFATGSSRFQLNEKTALRSLEVVGECLDTIKEVRLDLWFTDVCQPTRTSSIANDLTELLYRVHEFMTRAPIAHIQSTSSGLGYEEAFAWGREWPLKWPDDGWLQDYLRIQTANLKLGPEDFRPGYPAWHYLSSYISPSTGGGRARTTVMYRANMDKEISPEHLILASRMRQKRAIFKTERGYLGICPEWTRPGDWLCYLNGGCVPYVLRPRGDEFTLVGESYCHGRMQNVKYSTRSSTSRKFLLV